MSPLEISIKLLKSVVRSFVTTGKCATLAAAAMVWAGTVGTTLAETEAYLSPPLPEGLTIVEPPVLAERVAAGELPPAAERLPVNPFVVPLTEGRQLGKHGGDLRTLVTRSKDTRLLSVYGYARLVGYDEALDLVPDILEKVEVEDGRIFTLYLRKGHRWSDGNPFTAEDFRYYWEDVALNESLAPTGPPITLRVDDQPAEVEIVDEWTVRYSWAKPNPFFLPALAGAAPLFICSFTGPLTTSKSTTAPIATRPRSTPRRKSAAFAIGPSCITGWTTSTAPTIRSCRHCSLGRMSWRPHPRASSPCAIPISIGSTPRVCSFPISTGSS
jgi:ABC-type transport system substrate-binding protein